MAGTNGHSAAPSSGVSLPRDGAAAAAAPGVAAETRMLAKDDPAATAFSVESFIRDERGVRRSGG